MQGSAFQGGWYNRRFFGWGGGGGVSVFFLRSARSRSYPHLGAIRAAFFLEQTPDVVGSQSLAVANVRRRAGTGAGRAKLRVTAGTRAAHERSHGTDPADT